MLTPSSAILNPEPQLYSHILTEGGEERSGGGEQSKGSLGSLYHLSPSKGGVPNFQMMGSFVVGSEVRCRDDGPAGPCLTVSL